MIDPPEITYMTPQLKAYIPMTVPRSQVRMVMGPALSELMAVLKGQGTRAAGPWFTHHPRSDAEVFDLEIWVSVEKPVVGSGHVMGGI